MQKQLKRIERDVERLDVLIGQMLQFSRLTASEGGPTSDSVALADLLHTIIVDADLEAGSAQKRIRTQHFAPVTIPGHPELLRRAIENVVRNAIHYSPAGGQVDVGLDIAREDVTITVTDQGRGVPAQDIERIFDPFYRLAEARDRDTGGTGLGLAITSRVMAMHGGKVSAHNVHGGGFRVKLRLPRAAMPDDHAEPVAPEGPRIEPLLRAT